MVNIFGQNMHLTSDEIFFYKQLNRVHHNIDFVIKLV